jgi:formylglycine-generating enzyme required for sulfatase activity
VGKRFPWGDEGWDDDKVAREHANFDGRGGKDKWKTNAPVGSFPPNGYGLFDMAGNAPEWVADGYDATYYSKAPKKTHLKNQKVNYTRASPVVDLGDSILFTSV